MEISESIFINATPERIFSYLVDVDNRQDYVPALEEVILLDPLPIKQGSRYTEIAIIAGRRLETTYQVTKFVRNEQMSAKTLKSVFPIAVDLILDPSKGGCQLIINMNFTLRGIFRFASGIVQGIVRLQAKNILKKLKNNIEKS